MINPNELRIGNWVRFIDDKEKFQIGCISHNEIEMGYILLSEVEPIPLTEEWLLKFGFDKGKIDWFAKKYFTDCDECAEVMKVDYNLSSKRLAIYDAIEETDIINILSYPIYTGKRINYVHQLQNIYFALTSEELPQVSEGEK